MKIKESRLDSIISVVLGLVLLVVYFTGLISGWLAEVVLVLGLILLLTGAVGFCPLYRLLGWNTNY